MSRLQILILWQAWQCYINVEKENVKIGRATGTWQLKINGRPVDYVD